MNIKDAKNQIKNAVIAYLTKDEQGEYVIPIHKQRPVFLMGPPGIGKTAIMEQIAEEMSVCMVSYSITHHTRQSALGLPTITDREFQGIQYKVSEYTMSEIIASVYDSMEETGKREGILFLDEINCVSETLSPTMLQFLQYKVFGKHRVPEGWIVVTAGNPPEYNKSVHDFDIVTLDRLKKMDIEPDYKVWREYALEMEVHSAILRFLEQKPEHFYTVKFSGVKKSFVTARSWEDLSTMIKLYELHEIAVDIDLITQYLQDEKIAREFAVYYELFHRYKLEYRVENILNGTFTDELVDKAKSSPFDERAALMGIILDELSRMMRKVQNMDAGILYLRGILRKLKDIPSEELINELKKTVTKIEAEVESGKRSHSINKEDIQSRIYALGFLKSAEANGEGFDQMSEKYSEEVTKVKSEIEELQNRLANAFQFVSACYDEKQEMVLFISELTARPICARFIGRYGSDDYFRYNKDLLIDTRREDILKQIDEI